jgi:hypothetical protein
MYSLSTQLGRPRFFRFDPDISERKLYLGFTVSSANDPLGAMTWVSDPLVSVEDSRLTAILTLRLIWVSRPAAISLTSGGLRQSGARDYES